MVTRVNSLSRWVSLSVLLVVSAACEMSPPGQAGSAGSAAGRPEAPPRLSKELLDDLGLQELWYNPPPKPKAQDAGIQSAYLLEEGLFVVTRPMPGKQKRYLKKLVRQTGHPAWYHDLEEALQFPPCAYTYPRTVDKPAEVFYSLLDTVHCLDLTFGDELWNSTVRFPVSTAMAANETHVFLGSDDKRCYGVRKNFGLHDWSHLTKNKIEARPVLIGGKVLFASHDGGVYGLEPARGWVYPGSWRRDTGARIQADMTPYASWVFVGSTDYQLYCIQSLDGTVAWNFAAEAPIVEQPVVYRYRANKEFVYCVAAKGPFGGKRRTLFAVPFPKGGLAPQGVAIWQVEGIRQVVSLGKNTLYVLKEPSREGARVLAGLDVETGKEKFSFSVEGFHFVPTNHADRGRNKVERGRIYLISATGAVQAIGEKL